MDVTCAEYLVAMELNDITGEIVRAAIRVHAALGPGLLESAYRACLVHSLTRRGLRVRSEHALPVTFEGFVIDVGYRLDLFVEDTVIVELKTVAKLQPVHEAQLLSYLRLSGQPVGLLINFNVWRLKNGIKRMINSQNRTGKNAGRLGGSPPRSLCSLRFQCFWSIDEWKGFDTQPGGGSIRRQRLPIAT